MTNYISRAEADELCDALIREYIGKETAVVSAVDIDGFVRDYLKCRIIYESIAEEDRDRIGFTGDGKRPLSVCRDGKTEKVVYPKNTIVLDKYLLTPSEACRRRFVLGHEAGHILANRINPDSPACFHHFESPEQTKHTFDEIRERYSINEWQANVFAAALLMPRFVMADVLKRFNGGKRLPVYGETVFHPREKSILKKMAAFLQVSFTALVIRLRDLSFLNYHDISEYIQKELNLGGED